MQSSDPDDDRTVIRPSAAPLAAPPAAQPEGPAPAAAQPAAAASSGMPAGTTAETAAGLGAGGSLAIGTRLGEFELTSLLGEGGFGIVYLAWDHSLERRVALKEYMPSALAMRSGSTQVQVKSERHRETFEAGRKSFVNEARLLAQFDHPSLVKVYRFWEANGTAYMVMPYYEGATLKSVLAEMGSPPDEAWLMALLAPLTEALAVLHAANCYHRDIAPDNVILLAGSGRPLLLDFGAARRVIGDMTQALTVILKPGYAPVEQYADAPGMKQGPWTDVYALAASVYFAMLGKTPPPSVSRLMSDAYVPLITSCAGRYSERFLAAMDRALKVRPEERTASVEELRADLGLGAMPRPGEVPSESDTTLLRMAAGAASTLPASATAAATGAATSRPAAASGAPAGRPAWLVGGAVALVVAGGAAWWALGSGGPSATGGPSASGSAASANVQPPAATPPAPITAVPADPGAVASAPSPLPAAVPEVAAPAGRFDVTAEFEQVLARQTPGFGVRVVLAPVQLRANKDSLKFSITSEREGDVTVLVHGPDGSLMRLLPAGPRERIRVRAGQTLELPPQLVGIPVSEPLGLEQLLVIVSAVPRRWDGLGGKFSDGYLSLPVGDDAARRQAERGASAGPYLLGDAAADCRGAACTEYGAARWQFEVIR